LPLHLLCLLALRLLGLPLPRLPRLLALGALCLLRLAALGLFGLTAARFLRLLTLGPLRLLGLATLSLCCLPLLCLLGLATPGVDALAVGLLALTFGLLALTFGLPRLALLVTAPIGPTPVGLGALLTLGLAFGLLLALRAFGLPLRLLTLGLLDITTLAAIGLLAVLLTLGERLPALVLAVRTGLVLPAIGEAVLPGLAAIGLLPVLATFTKRLGGGAVAAIVARPLGGLPRHRDRARRRAAAEALLPPVGEAACVGLAAELLGAPIGRLARSIDLIEALPAWLVRAARAPALARGEDRRAGAQPVARDHRLATRAPARGIGLVGRGRGVIDRGSLARLQRQRGREGGQRELRLRIPLRRVRVAVAAGGGERRGEREQRAGTGER
jgi:hypothetical protein